MTYFNCSFLSHRPEKSGKLPAKPRNLTRQQLLLESLEQRLVPASELIESIDVNIVTAMISAPAAPPIPVGPEFAIYPVSSRQFESSVDSNSSGRTVVVRTESIAPGPGGVALFAEIYGPAGEPLATSVRIDDPSTPTSPGAPVVAMRDDGSFVVAWSGTAVLPLTSSSIFYRLFDANGTPTSQVLLANSDNLRVQEPRLPDVSMAADGRFVISFQNGNGSNEDVFGRVFASDGTPLGTETRVNTYVQNNQGRPKVAMGNDGKYVVAWESSGQFGSASSVLFRKFNADGTAATTEIPFINNASPLGQSISQYSPDVAVKSDGTFIVSAVVVRSGMTEVEARLFDQSGSPISNEFAITSTPSVEEFAVSVNVDGFGNAYVGWRSIVDLDGGVSSADLEFQMVGSDGQLLGDTVLVSPAGPTRDNREGEIGVDASGNLFVVWDTISLELPNVQYPIARRYLTDTPPLPTVNGPYAIVEGNSLTLDGSGSTNPFGDPIDLYEWDVNGDGLFGDASGVNPTLEWSQLIALGINDGTTIFDLRLRVTDIRGRVSETSSGAYELEVANVAPTASISAPTQQYLFQTMTVTLNATDPSPVDQASLFLFDIDWEGDGVFDESVEAFSGSSLQHTYLLPGNYEVKIRATDKDGGQSSVVSQPVDVVAFEVIAGVLLNWTGSSLDDSVSFTQVDAQTIRISETQYRGTAINTSFLVPSSTLISINAQGDSGNDLMDASSLSAIGISLNGDDGLDSLFGGSASDLLSGGNDADTIHGGLGNDVLNGGDGADLIFGEYPDADDRTTSAESLGRDTIDAGDGNDVIYGDSDGGEGASDSILAGEGDDIVFADGSEGGLAAGDTVRGGGGKDSIYGDPSGAEGGADSLFGESGDDYIETGDGNDFADGGIGNDILIGGLGTNGADDDLRGGDDRDILIGDVGVVSTSDSPVGGADILRGGNGEDIVIAGLFRPLDANSLLAIRSEWVSSRSYSDRVSNISGMGTGPRANGNSFIQPANSAFDDGAVEDLVFGNSGQDWLIVDLDTDSFDLFPGETLTDL